MDENIKDSFQRVKQDIFNLKQELQLNNKKIEQICDILEELNKNYLETVRELEKSKKIENQYVEFGKKEIPAIQQINPAIQQINPTDNETFKPQKTEIMLNSTGNEGVPTDKQTNQQTNQHIKNNSINDAFNMLESLDSIKKGIRLQFKKLTEQEIAVFSAIYQMDEEIGYSDYKILSNKLNLSESSIRDYVGKIINKGIPLEKKKINNKLIQLNVSQNLKKITPLSTILLLREL